MMTKINHTDIIASCGSDEMVKFWSIDNFEEVVFEFSDLEQINNFSQSK